MDRIFSRVMDRHPERLQTTVLTVPLSLRESFAEDPRRWRNVVRKWVNDAKKEFGLLWAYVRTHPCGGERAGFAPHANILWCRAPGFRGRLDVAKARALWAGALGLGRGAPINLRAAFITLGSRRGVAQLLHWLRYVERPFPGWTWGGLWARWYGSYPKWTDPSFGRKKWVCACCGADVEWHDPDEHQDNKLRKIEKALASRAPPSPKEVQKQLDTIFNNS